MMFGVGAHHIGKMVHTSPSSLLVEPPNNQGKPVGVFSSKIGSVNPRVVGSHSLVWNLLHQNSKEEEKLLKACDEGDTAYLKNHLSEGFVMVVFQHLLFQNRDLIQKINQTFIYRNRQEKLRCQGKALEGSVVAIYEKANETQKSSIIFELFKENKYHLFVLLRIKDEIVINFISQLLWQRWDGKQIQERKAILNIIFKQRASILVEKCSEYHNFGNIFHYLDDEVKLKVVLTFFEQSKVRTFTNCLENQRVAKDTLFSPLSKWKKYGQIEGSNELLKVGFKKNVKTIGERADSKWLRVAIYSIATPALFKCLGWVLPLISDRSALIRIACEHGNLKSLDFLIQQTGIRTLSTRCLVNSARFGHVAVLQRLLNDSTLQFIRKGRIVSKSEAVLASLVNASMEDEGEMVWTLLDWIYENKKESIDDALQLVLGYAAQNRKDRVVSYFEPRRALLAFYEFCTQIGHKFPIEVLENARDLAEFNAADEKAAKMIQSWI